jgi:hypothetical protein
MDGGGKHILVGLLLQILLGGDGDQIQVHCPTGMPGMQPVTVEQLPVVRNPFVCVHQKLAQPCIPECIELGAVGSRVTPHRPRGSDQPEKLRH